MLLLLLACSQRFDEDTGSDTPVSPDSADTDDTDDTDVIDTDPDTGDLPDVPLELCINEFMPDNESSAQDDTLAYPDWIELHNPGDTPVLLDGWTLTDSRGTPDKHVLTGGLALPPGGFALLWADELPDTGPEHLGFKLASTGGEVALYAPDGRGSIVTYGEMAADFSLTRMTDCCEGDACLTFDFRGTPGVSNVEPVYEAVPLLVAGSTWSYWDGGTSPGVGWELPGFDASAWPTGAGPLGYGDTHVVTTVGYGADEANKYVTTWFRIEVEVPGITLSSLTLELLRDDGAIVYLNGVEVVRDNLPWGELADTTLASVAASGGDETGYFSFDLDPTALTAGTNTIAVALHQSAVSSSDLGFDLALSGERLVPPE
jgi:hypothetical protein